VTAVFLLPSTSAAPRCITHSEEDSLDTLIFGDGPLGLAVEAALRARATTDASGSVRVLGRPPGGRHEVSRQPPVAAVEASAGGAVAANIDAALRAGCRRVVIATTGWDANRAAVEARLREAGVAAVAAANFSIGAAVFGRLVERATDLLGGVPAFEPYIVEWHRASKADRPSGTARDLAHRIIARHPTKTSTSDGQAPATPRTPDALEVAVVRAGASPGMHLVGFDAPGETIELRLTARDRSAYAAGILAALDWLTARPREPGLHSFDEIVDDLLAAPLAAIA
jgi:4-hydroxy-tetrahydrodipicolinate reductase